MWILRILIINTYVDTKTDAQHINYQWPDKETVNVYGFVLICFTQRESIKKRDSRINSQSIKLEQNSYRWRGWTPPPLKEFLYNSRTTWVMKMKISIGIISSENHTLCSFCACANDSFWNVVRRYRHNFLAF